MSGKFDSWLFGKWGPLEKSLANWTKDVLFPEGAFCCACGRVTDGGGLCAACRESLLHDGFFFAWSRSDPAPDFPAWSLRPHEGVPRELIIRLKYGAEARAAKLLAELLLPLPIDVSFPPDTVVTWVTMPESRRRERAIDHGRLLAETFAEKLELPCRQLLARRDKREKRQVTLSADRGRKVQRGQRSLFRAVRRQSAGPLRPVRSRGPERSGHGRLRRLRRFRRPGF